MRPPSEIASRALTIGALVLIVIPLTVLHLLIEFVLWAVEHTPPGRHAADILCRWRRACDRVRDRALGGERRWRQKRTEQKAGAARTGDDRGNNLAPTRRARWLRRPEGDEPARPFSLPGWVIVVAAAVVLVWCSVPVFVAVYDLHLALAFALATAQCVALPLALRMPRTALLLQMICLVAIGSATQNATDEFWPVPVPSLLALTVVLVVVGRREPWYVSVTGWWLSFLFITLTVVASGRDLSTVEDWGVNVLVSITVTLIALAVSIAVGQRRRMREIVASARRDVELEQARRATVEERARIARELHDVVAHSMSIVHIQAESARFRVSDLDAAQREFRDIARSARTALGEMRQLLSALRPENGEVSYAPQPTVADIATLVQGAERVGSPVTFTSDVIPGAMSPMIELTAYRIVQEALSNVVRHAPNARVVVELRRTPTAIVVIVANDAPAGRSASFPAVPQTPETGGHGLQGMRERVELIRGEIVQQALPSGGFLIHATLPLGQESA